MKLCFGVSVSLVRALSFTALIFAGLCTASGAEYVPFEGEKSSWHDGFERFDYVLDEETLELKPFKRSDDERFGIKDPSAGTRRCVVVVPKKAAAGNPWSWQGCYWDHQPQTEIELLRRGYHVAYISANATLKPDKTWEAWYEYLTTQHGLSSKPAFVGMSRGGEYAYRWSTSHPDRVSCIYADNPAIDQESMSKLGELSKADVPIMHVCGSIDPLLGRVSNSVERIYREYGGRISVIIKEGAGHHPHSLRDPTPIADFVVQSSIPIDSPKPDFVAGRVSKTAFYSIASSYEDSPGEGTFITRRGSNFTDTFERYSFDIAGVEGSVQVILPKKALAAKPWVFRADYVSWDSTVDLALLAEGFAIVTGPVPYNADGPNLQHWNKVYDHLVEHGFSKKPVLAGTGGAAGEAYAWAIANPEKVACIYAQNPLLRCTMTRSQPFDGLQTLASSHVPIFHACGSLDPALQSQTQATEQRYRALNGSFTVAINEGAAHYPTAPTDVSSAVRFIVKNSAGLAGQ